MEFLTGNYCPCRTVGTSVLLKIQMSPLAIPLHIRTAEVHPDERLRSDPQQFHSFLSVSPAIHLACCDRLCRFAGNWRRSLETALKIEARKARPPPCYSRRHESCQSPRKLTGTVRINAGQSHSLTDGPVNQNLRTGSANVDQARGIQALSDCGAIQAALETEHEAIENALTVLGHAMLSGASPKVLTQIMDMVLDFCEAHFQSEEQGFRDSGYADVELHACDHARLLSELRVARAAISAGQTDATIDASVLLNCFHDHVASFDEIAHAQLRGGTEHDRENLAAMR